MFSIKAIVLASMTTLLKAEYLLKCVTKYGYCIISERCECHTHSSHQAVTHVRNENCTGSREIV